MCGGEKTREKKEEERMKRHMDEKNKEKKEK